MGKTVGRYWQSTASRHRDEYVFSKARRRWVKVSCSLKGHPQGYCYGAPSLPPGAQFSGTCRVAQELVDAADMG